MGLGCTILNPNWTFFYLGEHCDETVIGEFLGTPVVPQEGVQGAVFHVLGE